MTTRNKIIGGTSAMVLAAAMAWTAPWEGKSLSAYLDPARIWTICRGHTGSDVYPGLVVNDNVCQKLYESDMGKAFDQTYKAIQTPITVSEFVVYTDFVFNAGIGNFGKSTMLKKINRGDRIGACNEFPKWKYAGKLPTGELRNCSIWYHGCPGLWKRRLEAQKKCLEPLQ